MVFQFICSNFNSFHRDYFAPIRLQFIKRFWRRLFEVNVFQLLISTLKILLSLSFCRRYDVLTTDLHVFYIRLRVKGVFLKIKNFYHWLHYAKLNTRSIKIMKMKLNVVPLIKKDKCPSPKDVLCQVLLKLLRRWLVWRQMAYRKLIWFFSYVGFKKNG